MAQSNGGEDGQIKLTQNNGIYNISGEWNGTLTGQDFYNGKAVITVPNGVTANITLSGVTINVSGTMYCGAFAMAEGGTANITLSGTNTLTSGDHCAGLEVPKNATLTIGGSGSLEAVGDAAGIGGSGFNYNGSFYGDCGTITINSGKITAIGGGYSAGIGGGYGGNYGGNGGTITINGGEVIARGGYSGAGIGGGQSHDGSRGNGGIIIIRAGKVTAIGGDYSAGIGGGGGANGSGSGGSISISGGEVEATGGQYGAGIGGGAKTSDVGGRYGDGGIITISGGTVVATGGQFAAGIGGGSDGVVGVGDGGTVKISGKQTNVTANGGYDVGGGGDGGEHRVGDGGSLSVTDGATLEMKNTGTNVENPEYRNCTIIDKDGNIFKFNNDGVVVPTLSLEADPAGSQTLPGKVTLTATLTGAYPDNKGKAITFTVNGGQPVTYFTNEYGVATHSIINPPQGSYTFNASFAGDTLNAQATAAQISGYAVGLGTQAALGITGLDNAYTYGCNEFSLSTSGGSGSGAVSYTSSDPTVASVRGGIVTIHKAGTFTITATKAADSHYAEAKVTSHAVTVHSATPNMSLTASGGSTTSDPLTLTATVSKVGTGAMPTGTVTFKEGITTLAVNVALIEGKAVHTINNPTAGSQVYTVEYSGQTDYYNNTSTARTIGVGLSPSGGGSSSNNGSSSNRSSTIIETKNNYNTTGDKISQNVSRSDLKKLADSGKSLTLRCDKASMTFDTTALKAILAAVPSTVGNITFTAAPADLSAFPDAAKLTGAHPVYDFTISYKDSKGDSVVAPVNFPAGSASISLTYTPAAAEVTGSLFMVYVDGKGAVTWLDKSSYDSNKVLADVPHFSTYGVAYKTPVPVFSDIANHWAREDIEFVAARGLLSGTGNGTGKKLFSPDGTMTRGMFVTALGRLAGVNPDSYQSRSFTDVKADAYYAVYVEWAAQKNIVKGIGEGLFSPDEPVTREQMAVMMTNYAGQTGYSIPDPLAAATFADNDTISTWAAKEVAAMQRAGIVRGKDGNRFDPQGNVTRAEMSAVLRRFVEIVIDPATADGWEKNDSGHWLYYKDGKALTGWQTIGKLRYFFNGDGVMHEGWKQDTDNNKWYYWTNAGAATGWREVDGKWYYFDENGIMAVNTRIDGYEIGPDGVRKEE